MNILNFAQEHQEVILTGVTFIIAWLLPNPKIKWLGKKTGEKIPKKLAIVIKSKLDAFEEGLIEDHVNGNKNLISNDQLKKETENLKINLGLEPKLKVKTSN